MKILEGQGVTSAKGFEAAGVEAGIKYTNRLDMALLYSEKPCVAAGTFTTNLVKAAPVKWDKMVVDNSDFVQAVVCNAGIANAGTGKQGMQYCMETAQALGEELNLPAESILVTSTGVIGMQLPMDKIKNGIHMLVKEKKEGIEAGHIAARAIMTTDTMPKEVAVSFEVDGVTVTLGGMCKGSGMIHPNMCTMLGFLATDIAISKELLVKALKEDVVDTFNMISVDGDTSTNDSLLILANGMAGNKEITEEGEAYEKFKEALHYVNRELAMKMAGDGEGATALFECTVVNAKTKQDARILAKSVICSSLSKAAIYGHDANWGRFLCALGYSGAQFDPDGIEISYVGGGKSILVYQDGAGTDYSEEEATEVLKNEKVTVYVDMKDGTENATAWGCDLTYDYVKINADYRS
ncbi:MAG: bifunctional ornithine acetyltransferase/N-acetylglutamate synthase [Lachnospiraceae bacterium]|nr:bifunctional ornithine acetyltransferase/N-acetylglutamate synthase [Lachnospiraceae bacterium]